MPIRCKLSDLLNGQKESQTDFAERVGVSRQTVQKLCSNQLSAIDLTTLEKVCRGLGISVGELIVIEETKLGRYLRRASQATVVLGAPLLQVSDAPHRLVHGFLPADVEAAFHISEQMSRLAPSGCYIRKKWLPARREWSNPSRHGSQQRYGSWEEQADALMKNTEDILFVIGSDLVNGFTAHCLDTIVDVGYDPRGRTRQPQRMQIPYKLMYQWQGADHKQLGDALLADLAGEGQREGIWDTRSKQMIVPIERTKSSSADDIPVDARTGAIIYVDEPNLHHPHCLVIGIAGFTPSDTALATQYLFDEQTLAYFDFRLQKQQPLRPPVFAVVQIDHFSTGIQEQFMLLD